MGKNIGRKIAFWTLVTFGGCLALLIVIGLIGASLGIKPTPADTQEVAKSQVTETQAIADNSEAIKIYFAKLLKLDAEVSTAYNKAAKKAAAGDVKGTYLDFKENVDPTLRGATMILFDLKNRAPEGPDGKVLKDAAENLWLSYAKRQEAVQAFIEGYEEGKEGKFVEATTIVKRADYYLSIATTKLETISSKYGLAK